MRRRSRREDARRGAGLTARTNAPAAIVVAAGRGERARTEGALPPKQLREIGGRPAVAWAIDVLIDAGCFPVVVALPPDLLAEASMLLRREGVAFVAGGDTRQDSVRNSLDAVTTEQIVIHDGARPFAEEDLVRRVLAGLTDADAVVPVMPVDDTLKEVDGDLVVQTLDRDRIRRIQTPQAFRAAPLRAAHERAMRDNVIATDDAQLIEMNGGRVVTVPGQATNLKLTRPEDFATAELLARR